MRLLFVTPSFTRRAATDLATVEVATRLAARHQVNVLSCEIDRQAARGLGLHPVPALKRPFPALLRYLSFLTSSTVRLRQLGVPGRHPYDLIHSSGGDCIYADIVTANYCQAERLRLVKAGRLQVEGKGRARWLDIALQHIYMRVVAWIEASIYRQPSLARVVPVSEGLGRDIVKNYQFPVERIVPIPNGIDIHDFDSRLAATDRERERTALGLAPESFAVIFMGGDWGRKGLRYAIRALPWVGNDDVVLIVAGYGDMGSYRTMARDLGVAERVMFVGHVAPVPYLVAADAFIMPSVFEGFSLATLEAAAAGLPLLLTRMNGATELLDDGRNGFFVSESPRDIAEKIRILASDRARTHEMGSLARRLVEERFTWDAVATATERAFQQVVAERRGRWVMPN